MTTTFAVGTEFKIPKGHKYAGRYVTITDINPLFTTVKFRKSTSDDMAAPTSAVKKMFKAATQKRKPGPMVTVYRIEHLGDGIGCYGRSDKKSERGMEDIVGTTKADARHPTMGQDSKLRLNLVKRGMTAFDIMILDAARDFSFGFSSVEQLRAWMFKDEWLTGLSDQHYVLAVCEVPEEDVIEGNAQCMFIRPATYEKKNIREFFNL
jgi:hypothetical protein